MFVGKYASIVVFGLLFSRTLLFDAGTVQSSLALLLKIIIGATVLVVVHEFLPKTIFKVAPIKWLKGFSWFIMLFYLLLYPVSLVVSMLSAQLLKLTGRTLSEVERENVFSKIDLNYLLQENSESADNSGDINQEVKIFQNVLDFSNVKLRDCLVPRTEIVALPHEATLNTLKQTFIETGLSKILIYEEDVDNIVGYIHSSEMFKDAMDWKNRIKLLPIVPENMAAQKLMRTFMQEKKSIAVVVDEFGGTTGIVTLEDIMEEIFGEIEDEHDVRDYVAKQTGENEYLLSGRLEVEEANELFALDLPESEDYTTIAGYILHEHQHFPKLNEIVRIDKYSFKFLKVSNNRIELVKLHVNA